MRRIMEHKTGAIDGFTSRYKIDCLLYFESGRDIRDAIQREKQIKGWVRQKKTDLILSANPHWQDLSPDWFTEVPVARPEVAQRQILRSAQNDNSKGDAKASGFYPEPETPKLAPKVSASSKPPIPAKEQTYV
jgi:putative endonuclease